MDALEKKCFEQEQLHKEKLQNSLLRWLVVIRTL